MCFIDLDHEARWGSSKNWLQPKTKPLLRTLTKLNLPKAVKRTVVLDKSTSRLLDYFILFYFKATLKRLQKDGKIEKHLFSHYKKAKNLF